MKEKTSAAILVFNSDGKLALQKRSANDDSYPSHWDFSAAGGIELGEDHNHAALRELKEELGIESNLQYMGEFVYQNNVKKDTLYIYKTLYDGVFMPDPVEVDEVEFFTKEEIQDMLNRGEKFHPEFPFVWQKGIIFSK